MHPDLQRALAELRLWVHRPVGEIALVLPVRDGKIGEPGLVAVGDRSSVRVTPAMVLGDVLRRRATAYLLVHTHHADVPPTAADLAVTRRLVAASAIVGVRLEGHYVLSPTKIFDCFAVQAPIAVPCRG